MLKRKFLLALFLLLCTVSTLPYYMNLLTRASLFDISLMIPACDTLMVDSDADKVIGILPQINNHMKIINLKDHEKRDTIISNAFMDSYGVDPDLKDPIRFLTKSKKEVVIIRFTNFCLFQSVRFSFCHNWHQLVFINFLGRPIKLFQSQMFFTDVEWFQNRRFSPEDPCLPLFEFFPAEEIQELIESNSPVFRDGFNLSLKSIPAERTEEIDQMLAIMRENFIEKIVVAEEKFHVFPVAREATNYKFYTCFPDSLPPRSYDTLGHTVFINTLPSTIKYRHISGNWYLSQGKIANSHVSRL